MKKRSFTVSLFQHVTVNFFSKERPSDAEIVREALAHKGTTLDWEIKEHE